MAEQKSSSDLPGPLRTATSALRKVPGAETIGRATEGALNAVGSVSPRGRRLAVYTGAGVLGAVGLVEWPLALTGAAVAWLTQQRPEHENPANPAHPAHAADGSRTTKRTTSAGRKTASGRSATTRTASGRSTTRSATTRTASGRSTTRTTSGRSTTAAKKAAPSRSATRTTTAKKAASGRSTTATATRRRRTAAAA